MKELLSSYKRALHETVDRYNSIEDWRTKEKKIVQGIISDLKYSIEWMEKRRPPGLRRSINRRDKWARLTLEDPAHMVIYTDEHAIIPRTTERVTDDQMEILNKCLAILTERQREMFLLHVGEGFSLGNIAEHLGVKKATVQTTIERSKAKIQKYIKEFFSKQHNP